MPTLAEIATGVGAAVGSALGAYAIARHRKKADRAPESEDSALKKDVRACVVALDGLTDRVAAIERRLEEDARSSMPAILGEQFRMDVAEIERELRAIRRELPTYMTVEEFRAYANLDSQKREAFIEKLGKVMATVDLIVRDMRRYER